MGSDTKRPRSIFQLPQQFFASCRIHNIPDNHASSTQQDNDIDIGRQRHKLSCNTCKHQFHSLQEQRSHFNSDFHRLNIKLSVAGKDTVTEEDFEDTLAEDYDISSISGSDDEDIVKSVQGGSDNFFVELQNGERVSVWRCLLLGDSDSVSLQCRNSIGEDDGEAEIAKRLNNVMQESRDGSDLRVVLLLRGGHFAGCVFDGNNILAHKTFNRYVARGKAGKKQSSKDTSGKSIHSAGAALRRYNEFALKKDIEELFASWNPYFASSSSVFIHAPSSNRQIFFDGENPYFICQPHTIRNVPLTVRRPTYKEAQRIYNILTQVSYNVEEETTTTRKEGSENVSLIIDDSFQWVRTIMKEDMDGKGTAKHVSGAPKHQAEDACESSVSGKDTGHAFVSTPLHEAANSGNAQKVLELLEQGLDPCAIDERCRTPYMLATEKEVRNTFRRFMASNLQKWDWHAAKVPSPLTKEMEESQTAKQAEKDAKKKARAKELKKNRKAREKNVQAEAAQPLTTSDQLGAKPRVKGQSQSSGLLKISKETERKKRAAAAERRIAAVETFKVQDTEGINPPSSSQPTIKTTSDGLCSCCYSSLVAKVPFHRVDIGTSEPLILDTLINAFTQISTDYFGIKQVFGGSVFEQWREELTPEDAGYSIHKI